LVVSPDEFTEIFIHLRNTLGIEIRRIE